MSDLLAGFERSRKREFRRWLGASALGHVLGFALLGLSPPAATGRTALPAVVEVRLLASEATPPPAARRPPPAAQPRPKPPPAAPKPEPRPRPDKVVLPAQPKPLPPEASKPKPTPQPAAPAPKPEPTPDPKPELQPPQDYEDVMAALREEAGEPESQPVEVAAAQPSPAASGGIGIPISAEEAAWRRRAKLHVHQAWVLAPGFRMQSLETEVRVRVAASGEVLSLEVTRSSGNPWYDEGVERAVRKASPLPEPPEAGEWVFVFRPEDLL